MSKVIKTKRDMKNDIKSDVATMRATTKLERSFADLPLDKIVAGEGDSKKSIRSTINLKQSKLSFGPATRVIKPSISFAKPPVSNVRSAITDVKPPSTITKPFTDITEPVTMPDLKSSEELA